MALATLFVTMPFVARELIPILESMDMAQVALAAVVNDRQAAVSAPARAALSGLL